MGSYSSFIKINSKKEALNLDQDSLRKVRSKIGLNWSPQKKYKILKVKKDNGLKVALLDFGSKKNILREMLKRTSEVSVFPSHLSSLKEIKKWKPDGLTFI